MALEGFQLPRNHGRWMGSAEPMAGRIQFSERLVIMAKFLFVYRGGDSDEDMTQKSPEEMQQVMQVWMDWIQKGMEAGWLVDGGDALLPGGSVVQPDLTVTDGPFAESKELVGGYSMVEAPDLAAAVELAKSCPMPAAGGSVEVRQLACVGEPAPE